MFVLQEKAVGREESSPSYGQLLAFSLGKSEEQNFGSGPEVEFPSLSRSLLPPQFLVYVSWILLSFDQDKNKYECGRGG